MRLCAIRVMKNVIKFLISTWLWYETVSHFHFYFILVFSFTRWCFFRMRFFVRVITLQCNAVHSKGYSMYMLLMTTVTTSVWRLLRFFFHLFTSNTIYQTLDFHIHFHFFFYVSLILFLCFFIVYGLSFCCCAILCCLFSLPSTRCSSTTQPHYGIHNNHPAHQRYANTRNVTAGYVANAGQCIAAVLLRVLHIWYRRCSTVGRNITTALRSSIAGPCARSQVSPSILIQFIHCLRPVRKKTHSQTPKREGTKVPNNEDNTRKIVQIITSIYRSFLRSVHTLYHFTYILEIIHKHRT